MKQIYHDAEIEDEYTNMGGKQAYGLEYKGQLGKYAESAYVREPKVYWQA